MGIYHHISAVLLRFIQGVHAVAECGRSGVALTHLRKVVQVLDVPEDWPSFKTCQSVFGRKVRLQANEKILTFPLECTCSIVPYSETERV